MPPQISSTAMGIILKFVYTGRLEAPFSVDMLYNTAKLLKLQILIRLLEAQMSSAEATAGADWARPREVGSPGRAAVGRPARPQQQRNSVYQPTNSQLAAKRSIVRAAEPPEEARPSRFEFPDTDELELHSRLPVLDSTLFETLRQTPVKRAAPQENGGEKRARLEAADAGHDVHVLREYYEEQRRRMRSQ
ncbi:uncharacterized protein LOC119100698 [Pollicipes pollicipes]|uniref:uncharacterized protein LOC119100698 n=1 Tax=Pollicipes pollicipes TaxID=41117 RepID=UPI0018857F8D|nr:uncharacterized protein LOC119100698 [Pollicipes pollicipes]